MAEELHLELLGGLRVRRGATPITGFVSGKAVALLCYLAVTARTHFRVALATRFWSTLPEADARMNLRHVLANLRQLVGSHLVITRDTIAFNREAPYVLDVEQFEILLQQAGPGDIDQLREAMSYYRGDFLEGFSLRDADEFDEWMVAEGERLHQRALHALHVLATYYTARHNYSAAIDYATRLLRLEPWREETHRQLMLLLAESGQTGAALQQYDACYRILETELGVEPDRATTALRDQIDAGEITARPLAAPHHNLPCPPTPMLGRDVEQAAIAHLLQQPAIRLLTLVGTGGVGKTRLAVDVATQQLAVFADGIFAVDLATLRDPAEVASAIAQAIGIIEDNTKLVLERVCGWLGERQTLLLLDNFEHLLHAASVVSTLLAACPRLKCLVTSRSPLHLRGEHIFTVEPLEVPPSPRLTISTTKQAAQFAQYAAVELFVQRAVAVQPHFALTSQNAPIIAEICCRLDGLPLAIELAAARVKLLPPHAILAWLDRRLTLLTSGARDLPVRHQTLRATLAWSYELLQADEQALFRRLGVFANGFTLEAAQYICTISDEHGKRKAQIDVLNGIEALIDKSLVRRVSVAHSDNTSDTVSRFAMLETTREYALEHLREAGEAERISHWYNLNDATRASTTHMHRDMTAEQLTFAVR